MATVPKVARYVATVVSTKMQKSCVVVVERMKWNTHIKKNVAERTRMIVHDENDEAVIGDKVIIEAVGRKISNKKTFAIKEFVKRSSYEHEFYQHLNDPKGIEAVKEATRVVL